MGSKKSNGGYEVGYRKPPKETQFKPGNSGNPNGRPKGRQNTNRILERVLNEPVTVNENGIRKTITKKEAAIMRFVSKALAAEKIGWKDFFDIIRHAEESNDYEDTRPVESLTDEELERIIRRAARQG